MIALRMGDGEVIQCLPESLQETLDDGHIARARPRMRGASQHRPRRPRGRAAAAARERRAAATREPRRRRRRRRSRVPPPDARDARRSFRSTCGAGRATRCATR